MNIVNQPISNETKLRIVGMSIVFDLTLQNILQSENTEVDVWVDSVSLQPFTEDQWRSHQSESIRKVRKKIV